MNPSNELAADGQAVLRGRMSPWNVPCLVSCPTIRIMFLVESLALQQRQAAFFTGLG